MTNLENTQPVHNAFVVSSIASEFWQKEPQGENSLHTSPDGGAIPALCKVGGTGKLEKPDIKKVHLLDEPERFINYTKNSISHHEVIARTDPFDTQEALIQSMKDWLKSKYWDAFVPA